MEKNGVRVTWVRSFKWGLCDRKKRTKVTKRLGQWEQCHSCYCSKNQWWWWCRIFNFYPPLCVSILIYGHVQCIVTERIMLTLISAGEQLMLLWLKRVHLGLQGNHWLASRRRCGCGYPVATTTSTRKSGSKINELMNERSLTFLSPKVY